VRSLVAAVLRTTALRRLRCLLSLALIATFLRRCTELRIPRTHYPLRLLFHTASLPSPSSFSPLSLPLPCYNWGFPFLPEPRLRAFPRSVVADNSPRVLSAGGHLRSRFSPCFARRGFMGGSASARDDVLNSRCSPCARSASAIWELTARGADLACDLLGIVCGVNNTFTTQAA